MVIDGSLKGVSGREAACGWAVVEIDFEICATVVAHWKCRERSQGQSHGRLLSPKACAIPTAWIVEGGDEGCVGPDQNDADFLIKKFGVVYVGSGR